MKRLFNQNWKVYLVVFLSICCYSWFAYFLKRENFYEILIGFSLTFGCYFYFIRNAKLNDMNFFIGVAILFRLIFFFSTPTLSDDYFRFIWDGQLSFHNLNPFDQTPNDVAAEFSNKSELLGGMNSPNYYTVYPPIAQFIYFVSAFFSPNSILGSIITLRIFSLLSELGIILLLPKLLKQIDINPKNSLLYLLNPLVIIELCGNLHFETFMIFFFVLAIFLLSQNRNGLSAIAWSFAAGVKLLPIIWLPILIRKLSFKIAILFYIITILLFIVLWLPFYNSTMVPHFLESVNLYHATFEFNASIYYLIRWIGYELVNYNIIAIAGSWLSKIAILVFVVLLMYRNQKKWSTFFKSLLFAMSIYYFLALIVHPWYLCTLVFLSVFVKYRFAIVWSFLATLSYWAYSNVAFSENYILLAVEYIVVLVILVWELRKYSIQLTLYK